MAAFTSKATGNWNASGQTTWNEVGVPGDGDTVTINTGHTITITAGNPVTVGASGATGTTAIVISGTTGQLVVNADLTLKGDLSQQRGTTVTVAAGVTIGWVVPSGSSYKWTRPNTSTGATTVNLNGTANSRVTIKKISGAASDLVTIDGNVFGVHNETFSNVTFQDIGSSSTVAYSLSGTSQTNNHTWTNVLWDNCGQVSISNSSASVTFNANGLDFRNCKATTFMTLGLTATRSSGTRVISGLTFYDASTSRTMSLQARDITVGGVLYNGVIQMAGAALRCTFDGLAMFCSGVIGTLMTIFGNSGSTVRNSAFVYTSNWVNVHCITESGNSAISANTYEYSLWSCEDTTADDDDAILTTNACTFTRNLFVKNGGGINTGGGATASVTINHNTFDTTALQCYAIVIGELSGDGALALAAVKNNIFSVRGSGVTCPGIDIRADKFDSQTAFSLNNNAFDNTGNTTTSVQRTFMYNETLGVAGYLKIPDDGANRRAAATTLQAGTNSTTLVATGSPWGSVQVGDIAWVATKGHVVVSAFVNANTLTVDPTTARVSSAIASGDSCVILKRIWSDGREYGGTNGGATDIAAVPGFVAPTNDLITFDTANGGAGTRLNAVRKFVELNGIDYTGAAATFDTDYTISNLLTYYRNAYTPTNVALRAAADDGTTIGAVEGLFGSSRMFQSFFPG